MFVFERDFFSGHAPHPTPPAWGGGGVRMSEMSLLGGQKFLFWWEGEEGGRSCNFEVKIKTA